MIARDRAQQHNIVRIYMRTNPSIVIHRRCARLRELYLATYIHNPVLGGFASVLALSEVGRGGVILTHQSIYFKLN